MAAVRVPEADYPIDECGVDDIELQCPRPDYDLYGNEEEECNDEPGLCLDDLSYPEVGTLGRSTHISIVSSDRAVFGGIQYNRFETERLHYQNILDTTNSALQQVNDDKTLVKTKWFNEAFKRVVGFQRVLILSNFGEEQR